MQCEVLAVRDVKTSNVRIAHVRAAGLIGEVPCDSGVEVGQAVLRVRLRLYQGRIVANVRVGNGSELPERAGVAA